MVILKKEMRILKHKYGAVRVERNGFKFASKKERNRYDELILLQRAGEVLFFMLQPPFYMPGVKYVADFMVFWADGSVTVEDCKGFLTDTYKMKKRMMAIHYKHVDIQEM